MTTYTSRKDKKALVDFISDDGTTVTFCPQGGGFAYTAPSTQFYQEFELAPPSEFKRGTVTGEWLVNDQSNPIYLPCWSDGRVWNGWGMPYFARAEVDRLIEFCGKDGLPLKWADNGEDILVIDDDEESGFYTVPPHAMDGVLAWGIGAGSWIWDHVVITPTLAEIVERMKREIVGDIEQGRVPATVASFGELGSYVDENEYGGFCQDELSSRLFAHFGGTDTEQGWPEDMMTFISKAQQAIHMWLAAGGHRDKPV